MKRILALLVLIVAVAMGATTEKAEALNPTNLTNPQAVVNALYWDLDKFWGLSGYDPGVGYYNYSQNGQVVHFSTSCVHTSYRVGSQGFYCNGGNIYFDWNQQVGNINRFGDGSVAFWLAHEYAHHAEYMLRVSWGAPYYELLADCFAGLYFRYGVYTSRKLNYNDYLEARNQIWTLAVSSPSHGGRSQRLAAFDYGFNSVGYTSCMNRPSW